MSYFIKRNLCKLMNNFFYIDIYFYILYDIIFMIHLKKCDEMMI